MLAATTAIESSMPEPAGPRLVLIDRSSAPLDELHEVVAFGREGRIPPIPAPCAGRT
jgi:hypothetical protein